MYQAILFLPLAGALFAGLLGPFTGPRPAEVTTTTLVLITALLALRHCTSMANVNLSLVDGMLTQ